MPGFFIRGSSSDSFWIANRPGVCAFQSQIKARWSVENGASVALALSSCHTATEKSSKIWMIVWSIEDVKVLIIFFTWQQWPHFIGFNCWAVENILVFWRRWNTGRLNIFQIFKYSNFSTSLESWVPHLCYKSCLSGQRKAFSNRCYTPISVEMSILAWHAV